MSHAAGNLGLHRHATAVPHLTPALVTSATYLSGSVHCNSATLARACDEIFNRWRRFVSDDEARAEAEAFRRRFDTVAVPELVTEVELDAMLDAVADAMATS